MSKVVFAGCSFTAGNGWVDTNLHDSLRTECKDFPDLWVNLCYNNISQLSKLELLNIGHEGSSNTEIFESCIRVMSTEDSIKFLFCQWSSMPRYNFRVGIEPWENYIDNPKGNEYSKKYIEDLTNRFLVMHHLHGEILKVVHYSNTISNIGKKLGVKVYFINGLCPWDKDYFVQLKGNNVMPESYTKFTKNEILDINNKSDEDIFKLYNFIHNEYAQAGGIDPTQWINLYQSMATTKIDTNYDQIHPGIKSNQLYFQAVKNFLEKI
jgi:hypothetical protein